jgi:hypothetical protein
VLSRGRRDLQLAERVLQRQLHGRYMRVRISRRELHRRLRLLRGIGVRRDEVREPRRRDVQRRRAVRERKLRRRHLRREGRRPNVHGDQPVRGDERVPRRQVLSPRRRHVQRALRLLQRLVQGRLVRVPVISLLVVTIACASPPAAHAIEPASSSQAASEAHWPDASPPIIMPVDRTGAIGNMRVLHAAVEVWRVSNGDDCPTLERLVEDRELAAATSTKDDWGTPYKVVCDEDETHIVSYGPDRREGTPDDIVFPQRGDAR